MLLRKESLVTVNVIYYRPDFQSLLQEFVWSLHDVAPEIGRAHV